MTLEESILQLVAAPGYKPVKPRFIAKKLKVEPLDVRKAVKRLVREGRLAYGINHLVGPAEPTAAAASRKKNVASRKNDIPSSEKVVPTRKKDVPSREKNSRKPTTSGKKSPKLSPNRLLGVFQRAEKGFGFVRLRDKRLEGEQKDVYVPADKSGDAATGDVVVVMIDQKRRGGPGPRGEIVDIVERQTRQFVGSYFETADAAYVRIDGKLFARPIYVGDPGAKNVQDDDKVVIEMLRFPAPMRDGEGVVTEVLGSRGKPGVDTLSIIREFGLADQFAEDAQEEARRLAEKFDESIGKRTDLTGETVITIDPIDARDFDDAISLDRLENGNWRLGVHIADVSHFVRPRSALDREAQDRATSVYLPDRVLPMLPEVISNGLASLQPGKVRYTKTAIMEFTADGLRVSTELYSAAIKSNKRLAYEQVDSFLQEPAAFRRKLGAKVCDLLSRMHELAMVLRKRRFANGSLQLNMPEIKIDLDKNGKVSGAHLVEDTVSHQIIEEFMLAANEAVAEELQERGFHFLRRIHQSPSPRKLKILTEFVAELGYKTESLESRFELQKLLDLSADRPERHAIHFSVLRSLQRAVYSPEQEGHYALASQCYCHFTSPIRRYPDLTVHRLIDAVLKSVKLVDDFDALTVLGLHCSDREKRAEAAERDLTKLKLIAYLGERIGEEMDAIVTGVESYGIFVQGVELPAEGLVRVETLRDDNYFFDRASHTLSGHKAGNSFRLGDLLRVAIAGVDPMRREIDFRVVDRSKRAAPKERKNNPPPKKAEKKSGRRKR